MTSPISLQHPLRPSELSLSQEIPTTVHNTVTEPWAELTCPQAALLDMSSLNMLESRQLLMIPQLAAETMKLAAVERVSLKRSASTASDCQTKRSFIVSGRQRDTELYRTALYSTELGIAALPPPYVAQHSCVECTRPKLRDWLTVPLCGVRTNEKGEAPMSVQRAVRGPPSMLSRPSGGKLAKH